MLEALYEAIRLNDAKTVEELIQLGYIETSDLENIKGEIVND